MSLLEDTLPHDFATARMSHHSATRSRRSGAVRTWKASFEAISKQDEHAANLLLLWTFLHDNDLWHGLLRQTAGKLAGAPRWFVELAASEATFRTALTLLAQFSVVQEHGSGSFSLYPGVRGWVATVLEPHQGKGLARLAIVMVGLNVPTEIAADCSSLKRRLLPHVERCAEWVECIAGEEDFFDTVARTSVRGLGEAFAELGFPIQAERMYKFVLNVPAVQRDAELIYSTMQNLACLQVQADRFAEAEATCQGALAGCEDALGHCHPLTLTIAHNCGSLYVALGRLNAAKSMYDRALRGRMKALGLDDPSTIDTVHCIGEIYMRHGLLAEAEQWLHTALKGRSRTLGPSHLSTLNTFHSLGMLYAEQGRLDAAEAVYRHVIEHYERTYGPRHPLTLNMTNNLGNVLKAEELSLRAANSFRAAMGTSHAKTWHAEEALGWIRSMLRSTQRRRRGSRTVSGESEWRVACRKLFRRGRDAPSPKAL
ncbi:hypothetical protein PCL_07076 [Purpureocillium lilacinum]|uniref:Uncharacterized protein n=1 Tax=Purpureocillium lilacinum TaxID=33203 RepID=A0A2U3DT96_PURLI|nr:hypothetical protein PCL_07076 [Purpureocillium lilacinum]